LFHVDPERFVRRRGFDEFREIGVTEFAIEIEAELREFTETSVGKSAALIRRRTSR